ncbi:hypothetical protein H4R24_004029 [Coemansia sp. RSA 988]|nr:hypothetical protein H4R24_004029 [Coemansia sp. RSA 988]
MHTIQIAAAAILAATTVLADTIFNVPVGSDRNAARAAFLEHDIQGYNPVAHHNANGLYPSANDMSNQHPNAIMQNTQPAVNVLKQAPQPSKPATDPLAHARGPKPGFAPAVEDSAEDEDEKAPAVQQLATNVSPAPVPAAAPIAAALPAASPLAPAALTNSIQQVPGVAGLAAAIAPGAVVVQQAGLTAKPQAAGGVLTSRVVALSTVAGPPAAGQLMAATTMPNRGPMKAVFTTVTAPAAFDDEEENIEEEEIEDDANDSVPVAATAFDAVASGPAISSASIASNGATVAQEPLSFVQMSTISLEPLAEQKPLMFANKASMTAFKPDDLDKFIFPSAEASVNMAGPNDAAHSATSASHSPHNVAFQGSKPAEQISHPKATVSNTKALMPKSLGVDHQSSKARASAPTSATDTQADNAAPAVSTSAKAVVAAVVISAFGNLLF